MNTASYATTAEAASAASIRLHALLSDPSQPVLLFLSGGSNFGVLMADHLPEDCAHITVTMLDDRVDHNPTVNNFVQLQQLDWYIRLLAYGAKSISTAVTADASIDLATAQQMATNINARIQAWRKSHPDANSLPQWELEQMATRPVLCPTLTHLRTLPICSMQRPCMLDIMPSIVTPTHYALLQRSLYCANLMKLWYLALDHRNTPLYSRYLLKLTSPGMSNRPQFLMG